MIILERRVLITSIEAAADSIGLLVHGLEESAAAFTFTTTIPSAIPVGRLSKDGVNIDFIVMLPVGVGRNALTDRGHCRRELSTRETAVLHVTRSLIGMFELAFIGMGLSGLTEINVPLNQR